MQFPKNKQSLFSEANSKQRMTLFNQNGFTLVELLIVIAIIGILAAAVALYAFKAAEKAKVTKVQQDIISIRDAALAYYTDTGQFPPDDDLYVHNHIEGRRRGWDFLTNAASAAGSTLGISVPRWNGPYLETWPTNPFWKTSAGDQEEGYQWEGTGPTGAVDFDNDGQKDPCIEIGFGGYSAEEVNDICEKIDRQMDDGNIYTGNFRKRSPGDQYPRNMWAYYRVTYH